jgi:hypothetical protein
MLIWILFVYSICLNDAHKEVQGMAEKAMDELERQNAKT